jgi:drug/metabolite transporter (DMT)-like permease
LWKILKRWKFLLFLALNNVGSVFYGFLLGRYPEQFSSITANALTVAVTFITESILKKKPFKLKQVAGVLLIVAGIYFIL